MSEPNEEELARYRAESEAATLHFAAIGHVAESFAQLELLVDITIWTLAGLPDDRGACITAQISGHGRKFAALISLMRIRDLPKRMVSVAEDLSKRADSLGEQRHRVIHDPWLVIGRDPPQRFEVTARKRLILDARDMPTAEVSLLSHRIDAAAGEVDDLRIKIVEALGAQPSP